MTHAELWAGIQNLAKHLKISCSRLAVISGLDPTTFNHSKTYSKYGQLRWPNMSSIAQILDATGLTLEEFARFLPSDTHVARAARSKTGPKKRK